MRCVRAKGTFERAKHVSLKSVSRRREYLYQLLLENDRAQT